MIEDKLVEIENARLSIRVEQHVILSDYLERDVIINVYRPAISMLEGISLLLVNDGQDLPKMPFEDIYDDIVSASIIEPLVVVGIHCGTYREQEYGTICRQDYKGRGTRAGLYAKFVFDELLPFLKACYKINSFKDKAFAGFSLGGLTALDLVWNYPNEFKTVGVFSGSLWWRRRGIDDGYDWEKDRIMHLQITKGRHYEWLKFFIQTGALDETSDRNKNGIIDSIDDALDLIEALKQRGYTKEQIAYLELEDGKHDVETWGRAFPAFLHWGWGKDNNSSL